jgi:hypothetical protein
MTEPDTFPARRVASVDSLPFPEDLFRCPFKRDNRRCVEAVGDTQDTYRSAFELFVDVIRTKDG